MAQAVALAAERGVASGRQLRRMRRGQRLSQIKLAKKLDISASYLNLIEHGHRPLTDRIVLKAAEVFGVDVQELATSSDLQLTQDLSEMFGDRVFGAALVSQTEITEAAASMPNMSRAVLELYGAYRGAQSRLDTFSERMANEPYLAGLDHEFRTLITSIQSFSEILRDNADLGPDQRQQFLGIIADESRLLSQSIESVLDQVGDDGGEDVAHTRLPAEKVADVFQANMNYFPNLEAAAERVRADMTPASVAPASVTTSVTADAVIDYLRRRHKVETEVVPDGDMPGVLRRYDPATRRLLLSRRLQPGGQIFQAAVQIGLLENVAEMAGIVGLAGVVEPSSQALTRNALANYFAAALMMPYEAFLAAAEDSRYDIERLSRRYGASFEQVCHRLTTLQKPGTSGVPFHLVRVDIAGNISLRFSASGIRIPRYGGLCPRWNVHGAFLTPGAINRQIAEMPDGRCYISIAKAINKGGGGFHAPQSHLSIGIGCDLSHAGRIVYGDDLDFAGGVAATPVGTSCRLCPRSDCRQRAFPSFDHHLELNENVRGDTVHVTPQMKTK